MGPLLVVAFLLVRANANQAKLAELYNRSAQYHDANRNPVHSDSRNSWIDTASTLSQDTSPLV